MHRTGNAARATAHAPRALALLLFAAAAACGAGASTIVTQFPPTDTALGQLTAAAGKASCTTEQTTIDGAPAVRVTCAEGSVTLFREKGTLRVDMGDKILGECGGTPRPACDVVTNRILDIAQGKTPAPAGDGGAAPSSSATAATSTTPAPAPAPAPLPTPTAAPTATATATGTMTPTTSTAAH